MSSRVAYFVCALFGGGMFALYFVSHPDAGAVTLKVTTTYWQVIYAFALMVGVVSFVGLQLRGIAKRQDHVYRVIGLSGLLAMPIAAAFWGTGGGSPFTWIFENIQVPLQSTVFALLAFFVASASLRGFRARTLPASVLLVSALVILLSRSTLGLSENNLLSDVAEWVRSYPSMAARRAILIGIGLGALTTSLRVILGIERTWLGSSK